MENKIVLNIRKFVKKIDRSAGIQLIMICMTLVAFIILLYIQQYLPSFEGSQSKLIIVDVLLGIGLIIEFGYFIWHTNKYGTVEETSEINQVKEVEKHSETDNIEKNQVIIETEEEG